MKIVVQGNCQSVPVTTFMSAACPEVEMLEPVVTQLQSTATFESDYEKFHNADLIFAQWVSDDFRVKHLATSRIEADFGDKVISWPNAFFTGQSPDVVSIATSTKPRVLGPLDTYHLRSIFNAWLNGDSVVKCINDIENINASYPDLSSEIKRSFTELKNRELLLDVNISDFIENHWLEKKLFHVFNHPTNVLLVELVERLIEFAEIKNSVPIMADFWPEALNRVIAPTIPAMDNAIGTKYRSTTSSKGFALKNIDNDQIAVGAVTVYSLKCLVETFYKAYDTQLTDEKGFTFTPVYMRNADKFPKAA